MNLPAHVVPNRDSPLEEREKRARAIREWIDSINGVRNDAQVYPEPNRALGDATTLLNSEADNLWPRLAWESSDPPGPPSAMRIDVKVESLAVYAPRGLGVKLSVSIEGRSSTETQTIDVAIRAVPALIKALAEHHEYWLDEMEQSDG